MTLGCNNKSSLDGVCTHLLKIPKLLLVRYQIRARTQFPIATSPPYLYPPAGYFSKPKGHLAPGAVSCSPRRGLRASPPAPPKEGPSAEQQVSRGREDLCRLQRGREDPRPPAGPPGPTGTSLDPAAARVTQPPPDELGGRQLRGQRQGGGSRARKSKGARTHPTSNKSKSPQGTRSAVLSRCNRTHGHPTGSRLRQATVGPPETARPQRWKAGARPPRRPPPDAPRLRPAPPARRDSARACAVRSFRATGVGRRGRKCPWAAGGSGSGSRAPPPRDTGRGGGGGVDLPK